VKRASLAWQFNLHDDGTWSWKKSVPGQQDTTSAHSLPDYGWAVDDAIAHGFSPRSEPWVIVDPRRQTSFLPPDVA